MRVALLYPPLCDPTAPYLSVPLLAACLRRAGIETLAIDANAEAVAWLLRGDTMAAFANRVRARFAALDARPSLGLAGQLDLAQLHDALDAAARVPGAVDDAVAVLRDPVRFFDPAAYERAVGIVEEALRVASAACAPLRADFASWRTPFALLDPAQIRRDAAPDRDPFHAWYAGPLADRLRAWAPDVIGVSIAFPGQVQPAFAMAHAIRAALPGTHLACGGPAISQVLLRVAAANLDAVLGPFDSAVAGEGEDALVDLVRSVEAGRPPRGLTVATAARDLADLPAPDFAGMVPGPYLSPAPVLPYDAARGCYWGRCAFCHYGPVASGTARYRERPSATAAAQLADLAARHGTRVFYLSEDTLSPRGARALAGALRDTGAGLRWATDLRPEPALDDATCRLLADGGLLAVSVGVESASPDVLARIDKGVQVDQVASAVRAMAGAGVAVEAMAFTGFPGETTAQALDTVRWLGRMRPWLSLFICGEFALTHGSRVARDPAAYGVAETWEVRGDMLRSGLFWRGRTPGPDARVDDAVDALSRRWRLRSYPWAGSLSTAHTLLWYDRYGPEVFKGRMRADSEGAAAWPAVGASGSIGHATGAAVAGSAVPASQPVEAASPAATTASARPADARPAPRRPRYDIGRIAEQAADADAAIWDELVNVRREVSEAAWNALAAEVPAVRPRRG